MRVATGGGGAGGVQFRRAGGLCLMISCNTFLSEKVSNKVSSTVGGVSTDIVKGLEERVVNDGHFTPKV